MKTPPAVLLCWTTALCSSGVVGCHSAVNENKPLAEVRAEAAELDAQGLRRMALKYRKAILTRTKKLEKLADELNDQQRDDVDAARTSALGEEMRALARSISALRQRYNIYYQRLRAMGEDLSDIEFGASSEP